MAQELLNTETLESFIDPIYKSKDGKYATKKQLKSDGFDDNYIKDNYTQIGDTDDLNQEFQHVDGRVFSVKQFKDMGVDADRISNGLRLGKITPIEKKNQLPSTSGLQDGASQLESGTQPQEKAAPEITPTIPPSSSQESKRRGEFVTGDILTDSKTGEPYQIQNGKKVYAPSETISSSQFNFLGIPKEPKPESPELGPYVVREDNIVQKAIKYNKSVDENSVSSSSLKKELEEAGGDESFAESLRGLNLSDKQTYDLSKRATENIQKAKREIAARQVKSFLKEKTASVLPEYKNDADNDVSNYNQQRANLGEIIEKGTLNGIPVSGQQAFNEERNIMRNIASIIGKYGTDAERQKALQNLSTEFSQYYGGHPITEEYQNSPEKKFLPNEDAYRGYLLIKDLNPELAKKYENIFVELTPEQEQKKNTQAQELYKKFNLSEEDARKLYGEEAKQGKDNLLFELERTGLSSKLNSDLEIAKDLESKIKSNIATSEDIDQYNRIIAAANQTLQELNSLNDKYPNNNYNKARRATEELIGEYTGIGGQLKYAGLKIGAGFENIYNAIEDVLSYGASSGANKIKNLAILNEYTPQRGTGEMALRTEELVIDPEIKNQIDNIIKNTSLSKEDKGDKILKLLNKNPNSYDFIPLKNSQWNLSPATIFNATGDLAYGLIPFIAAEAATGGLGGPGLIAGLFRTFNAALVTGIHENYKAAVQSGASNPLRTAFINTSFDAGIMALAAKGASVDFNGIKGLFKNNPTVTSVLNTMSKDEITSALRRIPNPIFKSAWNRATSTSKDLIAGAKSGVKFESITGLGQSLTGRGEDIPFEEKIKHGALGVLSFGVLHGATGALKYKSPDKMQKASIYDAAKNAESYLLEAQRLLDNKEIDNEKYQNIVKNITVAKKVYDKLGFVDAKGEKLSENDASELLSLKLQISDIENQLKLDLPEDVKKDLGNKILDIQEKINEIYKGNYVEPKATQTEVVVGGKIEKGDNVVNKSGEIGEVVSVNEKGDVIVVNKRNNLRYQWKAKDVYKESEKPEAAKPEPQEGDEVYRVDYRDEQGNPATKYFRNKEESETFYDQIPTPPEGKTGYYDKFPKGAKIQEVTPKGTEAVPAVTGEAEGQKVEGAVPTGGERVGEGAAEAAPAVLEGEPGTAVGQDVVIKKMKPFTDVMVKIEREFENNNYEIRTDYDNEIIVTDKDGEIVDAEDLPPNLLKLAQDYEKAVRNLGEFDASSMERALAESRKVEEGQAEVVETKPLSEKAQDLKRRLSPQESAEPTEPAKPTTPPKVYSLRTVKEIDATPYSGAAKEVVKGIGNMVKAVNRLTKQLTGKEFTLEIHDTPESYREAVLKSGGNELDADTKGFYWGKNNKAVLNLSGVTKDTGAHELFHPVLDFIASKNPDIINKLADQLSNLKGGKEFIERNKENYSDYPEATQKKEAIVDYIANVASGEIKLDRTTFEAVRDFIINALNTVGINISKKIDTVQNLQELAKQISRQFKSGQELRGTKPKDLSKDKYVGAEKPAAEERQFAKGDELKPEESDYIKAKNVVKKDKEELRKTPEAVVPEVQTIKDPTTKEEKIKIIVTEGDTPKEGKRAGIPERIITPQYKGVPYDLESGALKYISKNRENAIEKLSDELVKDYNENKDREEISAAIGWYGKMRQWFQKNFGANIEMFGQLLAATSARTEVMDNFKQSVDAFKNYSKGKYNDLLEDYDRHVKAIKSMTDNELLANWKKRNPGKKESLFDADSYRRLLINDYERVPLRSNGKKFNANSKKVLQALYGNWIEQTEGPKTKNFAGNLTGRSYDATIDVWAARYLRRKIFGDAIKRWRILPQSEGSVQYNITKSGEMRGDYPFAEEVMRRAADKLKIKADDLQAFLWYLEKDVWGKNKWTTEIGKKKASFEEGAATIKAERYQAGITTFKDVETFDPVEFEKTRKEIETEIANVPGIIASRVTKSEGEFVGEDATYIEPTFDVEFTVEEGSDVSSIIDKIDEIQLKYNQDATIFSKIVPKENPNARPIIEVGLANPVEKSEIINDIKKTLSSLDVRGFTISKDSRGRILGFRAQFIPEFEQGVSIADGINRFIKAFDKIIEKYGDNKEVSYITSGSVDSRIKFKPEKQNERINETGSTEQKLPGEISRTETIGTEQSIGNLPEETKGEGVRSEQKRSGDALGMDGESKESPTGGGIGFSRKGKKSEIEKFIEEERAKGTSDQEIRDVLTELSQDPTTGIDASKIDEMMGKAPEATPEPAKPTPGKKTVTITTEHPYLYTGTSKTKVRGVMDHILDAENIGIRTKQGFKEKGIRYNVASNAEARQLAKEIIGAFGKEDAIYIAKQSDLLHPSVRSAIIAESIDNAYRASKRAKTKEERVQAAMEWKDLALYYAQAATESGQFSAYIGHFYKTSPLGFVMLENEKTQKRFDEWYGRRKQDFEELWNSLKETEGAKLKIQEEAEKIRKSERIEERKKNLNSIDDFFNKMKDKDSSSYGPDTYFARNKPGAGKPVIPKDTWESAMEAMKESIKNGDSVSEAVQKGVDIISKEIGDKWNINKFKADYENAISSIADGGKKEPPVKDALKKRLDQLEKQIEQYKERIAKGGLPGEKKEASFSDNPEVQALIKERDELRKENEELLKAAGVGKYSDAERAKAAEKIAQKSIDELQRKLNENELEFKKTNKPTSAQLDAYREEQKRLRKELEERRRQAQVGKYDPSKIEADKAKKTQERIDELNRRINEKDFSAEQYKPQAEKTDLEKERDRVQKLYDEAKKQSPEYIEKKAKQYIEELKKRLKDIPEEKKKEIIRRSIKKIIDSGGLKEEELKEIVAETMGFKKLTDEQAAEIERLVEDVNAVKDLEDAMVENPTPENILAFERARKKGIESGMKIYNMTHNEADIAGTFKSLISGSLLSVPTLIKNVGQNIIAQPLLRFPVALTRYLGENAVYGASVLANMLTGSNILRPTTDIIAAQKGFYKMAKKGINVGLFNFMKGTQMRDYLSETSYQSTLSPRKSREDLKLWKQGEKFLNKSEVIDRYIRASIFSVQADFILRGMALGDLPFRWAAEGAKGMQIAIKELGLTDENQIQAFLLSPDKFANKFFIEKGESKDVAAKKAEDIKKSIIEAGRRAVFEEDNWLTKINEKIEKELKSRTDEDVSTKLIKPVASVFKTLNYPFLKIPSNIAWKYFKLMNPSISIAWCIGQIGSSEYYRRTGEVGKQRASLELAKDSFAMAIVGTALSAVAGSLVSQGLVRSSNDEDNKIRETTGERTYGKQNQLNMGKLTGGSDYWVDLNWFGPMGSMLNTKAKLQDAKLQKEIKGDTTEQKALDEFSEVLGYSAESSLNQLVFDQGSRAINALKDGDALRAYGINMLNTAQNIITGGTYASISKAMLPTEVRLKADTWKEEFFNNVKARNAIVRLFAGYPPSRISIWGDPIKKDNTVMGVVGNIMGFQKGSEDDFGFILEKEFRETNDARFFPPAEDLKITVDGKEIKLTINEKDDLDIFIGKYRKLFVSSFVYDMGIIPGRKEGIKYADKKYSELTKSEKIEALEFLYKNAQKAGMKEFINKHPQYSVSELEAEEKSEERTEKRERKATKKEMKEGFEELLPEDLLEK